MFQRSIEWTPAYDKRPKGGIHGMNVRFILKGPEGATQFLLYTNWFLKHNQDEGDARVNPDFPHLTCHPLPSDLGYHSPRPVYAEQTTTSEACLYLDGKPCYYGGSGCNAEELYWKFVSEGEGVVWTTLEEWYWDIVQQSAVLLLTGGPTGNIEEQGDAPLY